MMIKTGNKYNKIKEIAAIYTLLKVYIYVCYCWRCSFFYLTITSETEQPNQQCAFALIIERDKLHS